ncbi:MAG: hypothetical protein H6735_04945 [Alphaproteobacteria bacterium]|nr:hypothetical protein [Alphaproteobacteria bacterium]
MERIPIDPLIFGEEQMCFGCGPHNHHGLQLRFFREGDHVVTTLDHQHAHWQGPPNILHGGLQATLADEVGAWTLVGLLGRFGLTARDRSGGSGLPASTRRSKGAGSSCRRPDPRSPCG